MRRVSRFVRRTLRAVRIAAADRRIPRPLRWLVALGAAPIPGPFDELLLLIVAVPLVLFYRRHLRDAWRAAGRLGSAAMTGDHAAIGELALSYTEAWCSRDAARVASHYAPGGTIAINGGEHAPIEEVAAGFIAAFPDITVYMDELHVDGERVRYDWTFTGTSSETGKWVRIPGSEEWTIGADGLIATSVGRYDGAEYERQLREGT